MFVLFWIKYTLNLKRNEIERWERYLHKEYRAVAKVEKHLTEDLNLFDQFLDTWNRNASDATFRYFDNYIEFIY